jgi:hypothetical protein
MNGNWKKAVMCGLLLCGLLIAAEAKATIVIPAPYAPYQTNLGAWDADPNNEILQQDKLFTLISASATLTNPGLDPLNPAPIRFALNVIGGIDNHVVTLGDSSTSYTMLAGVYDLHYSITVTDPTRYISSASLGVDIGGHPGVVATKTFRDREGKLLGAGLGGVGVIKSVDGAPDTTALWTQYLDVTEHIVVTGTGAVFSTTDTYTEAVVPEPASIAIWASLAGVGLVIGYKRRMRNA